MQASGGGTGKRGLPVEIDKMKTTCLAHVRKGWFRFVDRGLWMIRNPVCETARNIPNRPSEERSNIIDNKRSELCRQGAANMTLVSVGEACG